jgi:2-(1,2-epoxy-1,2-dihydrophenyl)acetyl-CoA isomerase
MGYDFIRYEVAEGVGTLTLDRPDKMNAILEEQQPEIRDAIALAKQDVAVRVLVVTGSGRGFCAGADVSRLNRQAEGGLAHALKPPTDPVGAFIGDIYAFPKPTLAVVNGLAVGAGVSLALACELRIGSTEARFVPAWLTRGIPPDTGSTWFLPRLVGMAKATEILYTARSIAADEALALGLLSRVVAPEELAGATRELAGAVAKGPPLALRFTKRGLQRGHDSTLAEALDYETYAQQVCFASEDFTEGMAAFWEKRAPEFKGH